jgi:rod shape-determining protein MreD
VKGLWIALSIGLAVALQSVTARVWGNGPLTVDFMLVAVVSVALLAGPSAGLVAGTFGGLLQDAVSSGILGVGGLAKTVVGFVVGSLARQFIVAEPLPRLVVFFGATLVHALLFMGLYEVLGLREFGAPLTRVLGQAIGNAVVGVLAVQFVERMPGVAERRRAARPRLRR